VTDASEPVWVEERVALAIHDRQLAEHGGCAGVRDAGLLASALARPINCWVCGDYDPAALAAAYAFGVSRNHPFVDGNKRTAWVVARVFLAINGYHLEFTPQAAIEVMLALAAGNIDEPELATWFREHLIAPM
jgi:death-on-curing protein